LDDQVLACMNCGSADVRSARMEDGIVPGYTELTKWVCRRCGNQGPGMLFADEASRAAFESQRRAEGAGDGDPDEDGPTYEPGPP
jgi:hypothetical protein